MACKHNIASRGIRTCRAVQQKIAEKIAGKKIQDASVDVELSVLDSMAIYEKCKICSALIEMTARAIKKKES